MNFVSHLRSGIYRAALAMSAVAVLAIPTVHEYALAMPTDTLERKEAEELIKKNLRQARSALKKKDYQAIKPLLDEAFENGLNVGVSVYDVVALYAEIHQKNLACETEIYQETVLNALDRMNDQSAADFRRSEKDKVFAEIRRTVSYRVLQGHEVGTPVELEGFLTNVKWHGEAMGVHGSLGDIEFFGKEDPTGKLKTAKVKVRYRSFVDTPDGEVGPVFWEVTGTWHIQRPSMENIRRDEDTPNPKGNVKVVIDTWSTPKLDPKSWMPEYGDRKKLEKQGALKPIPLTDPWIGELDTDGILHFEEATPLGDTVSDQLSECEA